jgi:hypothetical protein
VEGIKVKRILDLLVKEFVVIVLENGEEYVDYLFKNPRGIENCYEVYNTMFTEENVTKIVLEKDGGMLDGKYEKMLKAMIYVSL